MRAYGAWAHERTRRSLDGRNGVAEVAHWAAAIAGLVVLGFEGEMLQRRRGRGLRGAGIGVGVVVVSLGAVVAVRSGEIIGNIQRDLARGGMIWRLRLRLRLRGARGFADRRGFGSWCRRGGHGCR